MRLVVNGEIHASSRLANNEPRSSNKHVNDLPRANRGCIPLTLYGGGRLANKVKNEDVGGVRPCWIEMLLDEVFRG